MGEDPRAGAGPRNSCYPSNCARRDQGRESVTDHNSINSNSPPFSGLHTWSRSLQHHVPRIRQGERPSSWTKPRASIASPLECRTFLSPRCWTDRGHRPLAGCRIRCHTRPAHMSERRRSCDRYLVRTQANSGPELHVGGFLLASTEEGEDEISNGDPPHSRAEHGARIQTAQVQVKLKLELELEVCCKAEA